ncbi:histidine--tRNA ligase [Adhaeribacter radiodurans]|uniref:Histidine--tRNA ligase n=1 Tax=Adhaeribacter radiodurans TaxID=2745197 RepID=A0A7L7L7Z5_9BACT|nr:histidine--tRNA ligase [Adhaeribacter radiodurans]QMU28946.1 histidine--tRNA ligase [Adhaeribacter radiodurans]
MSKEKPSLPKGTRDFNPEVVGKRNYIFNTIKQTFQKFGFQPLETPAMENLSVLTGKYGEEGDQLMFKILNNGLHEKKEPEKEKLQENWNKILQQPFSTSAITERALRYDLTVPFARFVVMNRNEITFPFKRYQIQPVWRADRPQKGRYREFYQCDADVVGTKSLLCEAEIVLMLDEVLTSLGIEDFTIKINHRKVLGVLYEFLFLQGAKGTDIDLFVAIDKIDKIGLDGVRKELIDKGYTSEMVNKLFEILSLNGSFEKINELEDKVKVALGEIRDDVEGNSKNQNNTITKIMRTPVGFVELRELREYLNNLGFKNFNRLALDITLARGLSYYTGCIFEVKVNNVKMGSISGGGRYDNLTGMFGLPNVSGVGISFGVDRIYDVMEELNLFPESAQTSTQVLITNFDASAEVYALPILQQLRAANIATELYPDQVKLAKQMTYADQKKIPYVLLIGSEEIASGLLKLKNMRTGEQESLRIEEILKKLAV